MAYEIAVSVKNKIATAAKDALYVCGNSDYIIRFDFDDEWTAEEVKTARFNYGLNRADIVFTGNVCPVPVIANATHFYVGVYAGDLHTTTPAYVSARKSILCGGMLPPPPPPDVYTQILAMLREGVSKEELEQAVEEALAEAKESGQFDGENVGLTVVDGMIHTTFEEGE